MTFVPTVRRLLNEIKNQKRALFLILDDINGLAGSEVFANWLKSTVDEISTSQQKMPLCILVVGTGRETPGTCVKATLSCSSIRVD